MSWEGSAIFSILLRREVPKHVATKGHRIRPHDVISIQGFFYWIHLVVLLDVTGFFLQREGRSRSACALDLWRTCASENKWDVSDIFIRSIRFLEIVLVRLRNEKPDVSHFFLSDTSDLFLFEICSYSRTHATILYFTILYYTILYYTIVYYTILYYTILYYT